MSADTEQSPHNGMTRRELFRRGGTIAAGATATVTVGSRTVPRFSPVGRAAAIAPAIPIGIAAGAAGLAYLSGTEYWPGNDEDYSGYTGADALQQAIYEGALEMESADERVMTSIENNIQNSDNVALPKGKQAVIEVMNNGGTESEAQTAMQDAIDEYFGTIEKNVVTHYKSQYNQALHHYNQLDAHANIAPKDMLEVWNAGDSVWSTDNGPFWAMYQTDGEQGNYWDLVSYDCFGSKSVQDVPVAGYAPDTNTPSLYFAPDPDLAQGLADVSQTLTKGEDESRLRASAFESSSTTVYLDVIRFVNAIDTIQSQRDSVNSTLSGFVADVYAAYEPGDIPTEDLVDPLTAATEMNQDYEDRGLRSAQAAMLGIPTDAEFTAALEIVSNEADDGVWEVNADLFTSYTPTVDVASDASISSGVLTLAKAPVSNSTYELSTTDGETVEFQSSELTDNGDGTYQVDLSADLTTTSTSVSSLLEEDEFNSGDTYQPSTWSEPLYIAYSYVDENTGETMADFTQIESEFTVVKVTDVNGNEVDTFKPESQNTQTADVESLEEELAQIREAKVRMQEESQEEVSSGGGGGFLKGANSYVYVAIVAVIGYILIDNN